MKTPRKDAVKTQQSLLSSAIQVFVEKGYWNATIAEICERAGANIAAVNYHFGDKETLYRQAWRHSFAESMKAYPPDGGVSESAPARERLLGRVKAILNRIADQRNKDFLIFHMELMNSTGLLHEIMQTEVRPLREKMLALVRELLGPGASDVQVQFCEICIVSMCNNPMLMRNVARGAQHDGNDLPIIGDIEEFAEHVVKFSLAGIAAIGEHNEKRAVQ
ncbi:MAG: CerR family C-terminal domain-containing protein [Deltaproteobacteria bacterium]|nr:CerR family C-terminal domain-containing protein [Deltaproteobacteria bacterium]